jgi:hypothetical protein
MNTKTILLEPSDNKNIFDHPKIKLGKTLKDGGGIIQLGAFNSASSALH